MSYTVVRIMQWEILEIVDQVLSLFLLTLRQLKFMQYGIFLLFLDF